MLLASRNQDFMPTLFNELLNWNNWNNCSYEEQKAMPKMNVSETDTNYELELSVPGLSKEDLSLRKEEKKDRHYLRHEFSTMQFKQLFSLPENVKKEAISAKVEHGILYVTLPKFTNEEKKALSQKITIC